MVHHWITANFWRTQILNGIEVKYVKCYRLLQAKYSGVDDGLWWVLFWIESKEFDLAKKVLTHMRSYYDEKLNCMYWDKKKTYMNAVTNLLFVICAKKLDMYYQECKNIYLFIKEYLFNPEINVIYDGINKDKNVNKDLYSYNQGLAFLVFLEFQDDKAIDILNFLCNNWDIFDIGPGNSEDHLTFPIVVGYCVYDARKWLELNEPKLLENLIVCLTNNKKVTGEFKSHLNMQIKLLK